VTPQQSADKAIDSDRQRRYLKREVAEARLRSRFRRISEESRSRKAVPRACRTARSPVAAPIDLKVDRSAKAEAAEGWSLGVWKSLPAFAYFPHALYALCEYPRVQGARYSQQFPPCAIHNGG